MNEQMIEEKKYGEWKNEHIGNILICTFDCHSNSFVQFYLGERRKVKDFF